MKTTTWSYPRSLLSSTLLLCLTFLASTCFFSKALAREQHPPQALHDTKVPEASHDGLVLTVEQRAVIGLKMAPATLRLVQDTRLLNGVVKADPDRVAMVTSHIAGRTVGIHVKLGDQVEKGQDLAEVQSVELEKLQLELIQAENELSPVKADLKRIHALVDEGVTAKKELLYAETRHRAIRNEIDSLTQQLNIFGMPKAQIQQVRRKKTVSRLHLPAPIAGTIVERNIVLGQAVEPQQSLFKIVDDTVMVVEANAFEDTFPFLKLGKEVFVRVPAYPKEEFKGKITFISNTVDPQTRTVHIWTRINNPLGLLKQNLFADLSVVLGENQETLAVPLEALLSTEGDAFVFVEHDGAFVRRDLILGTRDNHYAAVKQGLSRGEQVVTDGKWQLYTQYQMSQRGGATLGGHGH